MKEISNNYCPVLEDEDILSNDELKHIKQCRDKIQQGDYSEFENWETVKNQL